MPSRWIRQQLKSNLETLCFRSTPNLRSISYHKGIYNQKITDLELAMDPQTKKSRHQYYLLSKYELLKCSDVEKMVKKRQSPEERPLYFTTIEKHFPHYPQRSHYYRLRWPRQNGETPERQVRHHNERFSGIVQVLLSFKFYCLVYQEKRKRQKTQGVVVKPVLSSEFNSCTKVDLIDMQSLPKGQFRWIMVYQWHSTAFVILRPLTLIRVTEVAFQLLDIFSSLRCPSDSTDQNSQPRSFKN